MEEDGEPDFISSSFIERDYHRTTLGGHTSTPEEGAPPVPGLKRALKVVIPAEFEMVAVGDRFELRADYADDEPHIIPANEIRPDHLDADERLQQRLVSLPVVNGPQVSGSGRQLIDIDAPLQASLFGDLDVSADSDRLEQASELLEAHERDHTIAGSHADTLLNQDTMLAHNANNMSTMVKTLWGDGPDVTPITSPYFTELYAMVAERRSTTAVRERQALDTHRRQVADRYNTPLDILEWLRDEHRLSYDTIARLLEPGRTVPSSTQWLACMLHDLEAGMPPEDIVHHCSLWEASDMTYSDQKDKHEEFVSHDDALLLLKLLTGSVETIATSNGNRLIKEWWVPELPDPFPLFVIRLILHLRDLMYVSKQRYDQPLIPTNTSNVVYKGKPVAGYGYQDLKISTNDPFQRAMAGDASLETLERSVGANHNEQYTEYIGTVAEDVLRQQGFNTGDEFVDWLTGVAPVDIKPSELVRWEFSAE